MAQSQHTSHDLWNKLTYQAFDMHDHDVEGVMFVLYGQLHLSCYGPDVWPRCTICKYM